MDNGRRKKDNDIIILLSIYYDKWTIKYRSHNAAVDFTLSLLNTQPHFACVHAQNDFDDDDVNDDDEDDGHIDGNNDEDDDDDDDDEHEDDGDPGGVNQDHGSIDYDDGSDNFTIDYDVKHAKK